MGVNYTSLSRCFWVFSRGKKLEEGKKKKGKLILSFKPSNCFPSFKTNSKPLAQGTRPCRTCPWLLLPFLPPMSHPHVQLAPLQPPGCSLTTTGPPRPRAFARLVPLSRTLCSAIHIACSLPLGSSLPWEAFLDHPNMKAGCT